MALNPFKESNLRDLQKNIQKFFSDHISEFIEKSKVQWAKFVAKGNERLTVMFIPHSEKRIINFHISIFAISGLVGFLVITIVITSILIINHSSTIKEVSKLKKYGKDSKTQVLKYREEIGKLYAIFQKLKPELTHLYSLTPEGDIDSLWAKGGVPNPTPPAGQENEFSPPLEVLNIQEIATELETTKEILAKVKTFLEYRKKIIENTPSIWPVDGNIISRYGQRISPHNNIREFHYGIDIEAFPGAEIKSTAPGKVNSIEWDPFYGLTVTIKHKYGFISSYAHCQRVSVEPGQKVSKGEVIGYVGRTGRTIKYICFYQIKIGTDFVDPMPYLNSIAR